MRVLFSTMILLFISKSFSQVSVENLDVSGIKREFKLERIKKFKELETIFLIPDSYDLDAYSKVLKEVWDVTTFKVMKKSNFNLDENLDNDFALVDIKSKGYDTNFANNSSLTGGYYLWEFRVFDVSSIKNKLRNVSEKDRVKRFNVKRNMIIRNNSKAIARVFLYVDINNLRALGSKSINQLDESVFYNFNLGYFKNYAQQINNLIKSEEEFNHKDLGFNSELKELKSNKLYVPLYASVEYNPWIARYKEPSEDRIHNVLKKYNFDYQITNTEAIGERILKGEVFYYLRYALFNTSSVVEIVNSKTGDIIYHNFKKGMKSLKFGSGYISSINKKIESAAKN